jgi:hypothetical protein
MPTPRREEKGGVIRAYPGNRTERAEWEGHLPFNHR